MNKNYTKYGVIAITLIMSIFLVKIVFDLGVIPAKFMVLGIIGLLLVFSLSAFLILRKNVYINILGYIISVVLIILSLVGINYGNNTIKFFKNAFNNNNLEVTTYNILALKSSSLKNKSDLIGKSIGVLEEENENAIKRLKDINIIYYQDIYELYEGLVNTNVESILLDTSIMDILSDEYNDIDTKTKVIYSFDIEVKKKKEENNDIKLEPMSIYISGSDSRTNKIVNKSRSDVNMILTINPNTKTVLMTSIPRDYYVQVHGQTGLKDKLTHAGIYGVDKSRETLEDLFGIEINYSVKIGFASVVNVVDLVGGVDIDSDKAFNSYHIKGWKVKKGINHMDGAHALAYARERYAYATGDRHRVLNQQQVLEAVLKKISTDKSLLTKYDSLLRSLSDMYRTDIPSELIQDAIKMQLNDMSEWKFTSQSVSGSDASLATHTAPNSKRYVMIPYDKDVARAKSNIEKTLKGEA